jgi:hypothetical protein
VNTGARSRSSSRRTRSAKIRTCCSTWAAVTSSSTKPRSRAKQYEAFIAAPGADAGGIERARAFLRELDRPAAKTGAKSVPEPAAPPASREAPAESAAQPRIWPWVGLGLGAALAGTGTLLYVLGANDHAELTDAPGYGDTGAVVPLTERRARELVDSGDDKKLWGGVALGVGGALIATSVVWLLLDGPAHEQSGAPGSKSWHLAVVPARSAGSLAFSGAF